MKLIFEHYGNHYFIFSLNLTSFFPKIWDGYLEWKIANVFAFSQMLTTPVAYLEYFRSFMTIFPTFYQWILEKWLHSRYPVSYFRNKKTVKLKKIIIENNCQHFLMVKNSVLHLSKVHADINVKGRSINHLLFAKKVR